MEYFPIQICLHFRLLLGNNAQLKNLPTFTKWINTETWSTMPTNVGCQFLLLCMLLFFGLYAIHEWKDKCYYIVCLHLRKVTHFKRDHTQLPLQKVRNYFYTKTNNPLRMYVVWTIRNSWIKGQILLHCCLHLRKVTLQKCTREHAQLPHKINRNYLYT